MRGNLIATVDTSKLHAGMIIPNYKEMCKMLGEQEKTGNSKSAQIRNWGRYFEHMRDKQKFIIAEIYASPHAKAVRNALYVTYIENIICGTLATKPNHAETYKRKTLYDLIGLHNERYSAAYAQSNENTLKINNLSHIPKWMLHKFMERTEQKMYNVLASAFKSMEKRELLVVNKQREICEIKGGFQVFRTATLAEFQAIKGIERSVLLDMGFNKIPFVKKLRNEYFERVNEEVRKQHDWEYVYRIMELIYDQKQMIRAYPMIQNEINGIVKSQLASDIEENRLKLNSSFIERVNKHAVMLCDTNHNMFTKFFGSKPKPKDSGELLPEDYSIYPDEFLDFQYVLSEVLLRLPVF